MSHTDTNANDEHSPPAWNTRTLTMLVQESARDGELLMNTPQGSAFLSSISHLTYRSSVIVFDDQFLNSMYNGFARNYILPSWMRSVPWLSFKNLQTFSIAYLHIKPPFYAYEFDELTNGRSFHVELLMLSQPRPC
ncbi:hypothetical protein P692DRAFT_20895365 [Suillus brevipes Sb2]|nr:hypothetical protein P692DRAFT_20895365 [Suillus brevipes Sb2]